MLEAEWEFYENNRDALVEKCCGKHVVISGNKVVAAFDDRDVAYPETIKTLSDKIDLFEKAAEVNKTIFI